MLPKINSIHCQSAVLFLFAASLLALLSQWDYDSVVPTESRIVSWIPELGGKGLSFVGIYGSTDVDCFIYHVEANDTSVDSAVHQVLEEARFKLHRGDAFVRERANPPLEPNAIEVIRVSDPKDGKLVVAFLQQDELPEGWNGEINESLWNKGWPKSNLWNRYENLVKELE